MSELRRKILLESKKIVIKIGSNILVDSTQGGVNTGWIENFTKSVAQLKKAGKEVVIVSSGAVGTGMAVLGYDTKPEAMEVKQACAAVGQIDLMYAYRQSFAQLGIASAQILLSADDFRDRQRYKNLQSTLKALLAHQVVPVINENDSVVVNEIKVGDNDKLSSDVALFWDADLLLIFTDEDGLYEENPKTNPQARLLQYVPEIDAKIMDMAGKPGQTGSAVSTGGMHSKLVAIKAATQGGCNAFLANGAKISPHQVVLEGGRGTFFAGAANPLNHRKRWLSLVSTPKGKVVIDPGAVKALRKKHSSLLPVGVVQVKGNFDAKELIEVTDTSGNSVARGLSSLGSEKLKLVMGQNTRDIGCRFGDDIPTELIHKNDLMLL
ncbi:MAG: glutamate 5-kinase [Fibrobacter sp.]|mgnify:CR=1 FL=1|nr:glutamate 5-kinase [Fibrobacter sp.]